MKEIPLTRIEFYQSGGGIIDACRSASVPRQGEYVNIANKQWRVAYVSWSLDSDRPCGSDLRANVELEKVPDNEVGPIFSGRTATDRETKTVSTYYGFTKKFGHATYSDGGYSSREEAIFAIHCQAMDDGNWHPPLLREEWWQFWRPVEFTDLEKRLVARLLEREDRETKG